MATIPELLDGHVTLEVECLDRLYLNGYIGKLATGPGLVFFMRDQLGKPIPSPVILGQISEKFREAVKSMAEGIPVYQFWHKERKDDIANGFRQRRKVRDAIVFVGVAQEKAQAFSGKKVNGRFEFDRDKTVYVNHYYFYIDDEEFGPLFLKICSYAPWSMKLCLNGHEWAKRQLNRRHTAYEALDNGFLSCAEPMKLQKICDALGSEEMEPSIPEMAAPHSASAAGRRPASGLRLGSVDLADGSQPDADFRPAVAGPRVLRGNHPRQPGSGAPGSRATGL